MTHPSPLHTNASAFDPPIVVTTEGPPYIAGYVLPTGDILPPTEGGITDTLRDELADAWRIHEAP